MTIPSEPGSGGGALEEALSRLLRFAQIGCACPVPKLSRSTRAHLQMRKGLAWPPSLYWRCWKGEQTRWERGLTGHSFWSSRCKMIPGGSCAYSTPHFVAQDPWPQASRSKRSVAGAVPQGSPAAEEKTAPRNSSSGQKGLGPCLALRPAENEADTQGLSMGRTQEEDRDPQGRAE